jgi:tetratricopeptide (TPR) repeat protein
MGEGGTLRPRGRQPESPERERLAIDLRLEGRLALPSIGRFAAWMQAATEAHARAMRIGDAERTLAAQVELAAAANFSTDPPEAIRHGQSAVAHAEAAGSDHWLYRARYALAQAYLTAGWHSCAARCFEQSLAHLGSERATSNRQRYAVLCCTLKSVAYAAMGEKAAAEASAEQAGVLAEEAGRPYELIAAAYGRGYVDLQWDRHDAADAALAGALELAASYSVRQFTPVITCLMGKVQLAAGHWTQAHATLVEARALARRVGHALSEIRAGVLLASACARLGDMQAARDEVAAAICASRTRGFDGVLAEALLAEAHIRLRSAGTDAPATAAAIAATIATAVAIAARTGARPLCAAAGLLEAELLDRTARPEEARAARGAALHLFAAMTMPPRFIAYLSSGNAPAP